MSGKGGGGGVIVQELCESPGGLRSCVRVEVAVLGCPS